jgi:hypothetical protein
VGLNPATPPTFRSHWATARRRPASWRPKRGRPVVARKEEYRSRYKVGWSFAWLGNFRRLLIRWEHLFSVYRGFFLVAVMLLCLRWVASSYPGASGGLQPTE